MDRYLARAGTEGGPVSLAIKRTAAFWKRKAVMVFSPEVKGGSRVEAAWLKSNRTGKATGRLARSAATFGHCDDAAVGCRSGEGSGVQLR